MVKGYIEKFSAFTDQGGMRKRRELTSARARQEIMFGEKRPGLRSRRIHSGGID